MKKKDLYDFKCIICNSLMTVSFDWRGGSLHCSTKVKPRDHKYKIIIRYVEKNPVLDSDELGYQHVHLRRNQNGVYVSLHGRLKIILPASLDLAKLYPIDKLNKILALI